MPGGYRSSLIITGQEDTPIEIAPDGVIIRREDKKTTHEEADAIIVAQAISAAKEERKYVAQVLPDYWVKLSLGAPHNPSRYFSSCSNLGWVGFTRGR